MDAITTIDIPSVPLFPVLTRSGLMLDTWKMLEWYILLFLMSFWYDIMSDAMINTSAAFQSSYSKIT